jgi:hypothetical protein
VESTERKITITITINNKDSSTHNIEINEKSSQQQQKILETIKDMKPDGHHRSPPHLAGVVGSKHCKRWMVIRNPYTQNHEADELIFVISIFVVSFSLFLIFSVLFRLSTYLSGQIKYKDHWQ